MAVLGPQTDQVSALVGFGALAGGLFGLQAPSRMSGFRRRRFGLTVCLGLPKGYFGPYVGLQTSLAMKGPREGVPTPKIGQNLVSESFATGATR